MSPLARPRSLSCNAPQAKASIATSWVAAKKLWTSRRAVKRPRPVIWAAPPVSRTASGNHPMATSRVMIMPAWLQTIHCLRRPKRRRCRLSTNGPMTHFHVHGSMMMARNDPMASPVMPMRLNSRATAVAANPCGKPSLTYNPKNPARRPRREERRSGNHGIRRQCFRRMPPLVKHGIGSELLRRDDWPGRTPGQPVTKSTSSWLVRLPERPT